MTENTIVLVSDLDDASHGEIHVFHGAQEAAQLIESLLQSGFGRERIRVFSAGEMEVQVTQRPVVALLAATNGREQDPEEPQEEQDSPPEPAPEPAPKRAVPSGARIRPLALAEPYWKDGVRFSSVFKPA